jgi:hypothetical protein
MKFITEFLCLWVIFALLDPDTDPGAPIKSGSGSRALGTVHVLAHVMMTSLPVCRRDGTSWGFSIVGGAEPGSERTEPVHVLFVVPESPAAKVCTVQISSVADSELGSGIRCLFLTLDPE